MPPARRETSVVDAAHPELHVNFSIERGGPQRTASVMSVRRKAYRNRPRIMPPNRAPSVLASAAAIVAAASLRRHGGANRRDGSSSLSSAEADLGGDDLGLQRLELQRIEEAGLRIAACCLPAGDHVRVWSSNLPLALVSKPRPVRRRCTSRRWPLSRPIWSSAIWSAPR